MIVQHDQLRALATDVFAAAGCETEEARRVAHHLVEANLAGHDSHGVIRIPTYVQWLAAGKVLPNKTVRVMFENDAIAVVDGEFGLGQTVGEQATRLGIEKSARHGVAVVALRNAGHLGRIGEFALMAARAGKLSLHLVNTSGAGMLVAPFGGIDRRVSVNPIAAGVPARGGGGGEPIVLDISAATVAEGKIRLALNKGEPVPEGCVIDHDGRPTTDPRDFYRDPPGAILSIAGHKGYALGVMIELFAGALTGGSCSNPANAWRVANGMLSVFLDRSFFATEAAFFDEVERYAAFVKASRPAAPGGEVLLPGEPESRTRARRLRDGIDLDDTTWEQIHETAGRLGVSHGLPPPRPREAAAAGEVMHIPGSDPLRDAPR
jgi:uncharacterized oxidoreductase